MDEPLGLISEVTMTAEEAKVMLHSLGLDRSDEPYRNYYASSLRDNILESLVKKGFMKKGKISDGMQYYHVATTSIIQQLINYGKKVRK